MTTSAATPPPTKTEERSHSVVLMLLAPSGIGFLCSILSQANSGGAWRLFAGFGNVVGLLGIAAAVVIALVSAALRRISAAFLLFVFIEICLMVLLSWFAAKLLKNPWL